MADMEIITTMILMILLLLLVAPLVLDIMEKAEVIVGIFEILLLIPLRSDVEREVKVMLKKLPEQTEKLKKLNAETEKRLLDSNEKGVVVMLLSNNN
jgi:hypothetical protein